jgi:chemotaxis protein MotA
MWAQVFAKVFTAKVDDPKELIEQITELANIVRKDGMIALEGQDIANPYLAKGVALLVDGTVPEVVTATLENDNDLMKVRHDTAVAMWVSWADIAPAMGMIGTLIGLVGMLQNMSDPKSIGPAMAVALLTTMYGAIIANVLAKPISEKLAALSASEQLNNELIMQALEEIQKGTNPRVISDVLASRLPPKIRAELVEA